MFALLFLAFLYIAFQVAFSPRGYRVEPENWQDIVPGTAQMIRRGRDYIWAVRYADVEAGPFSELTDFVAADEHTCDPNIHQACEFSGSTGDGIIIRYVEQRPSTLAIDIPWFEGFVDPTSGALYDRFGRQYKNVKTSLPNGMPLLLAVPL